MMTLKLSQIWFKKSVLLSMLLRGNMLQCFILVLMLFDGALNRFKTIYCNVSCSSLFLAVTLACQAWMQEHTFWNNKIFSIIQLFQLCHNSNRNRPQTHRPLINRDIDPVNPPYRSSFFVTSRSQKRIEQIEKIPYSLLRSRQRLVECVRSN